jgi:uncharacterized protein
VVAHRNEHGAFATRDALRKVTGMGPRTFEQAAGFLRVPGGKNPLDNSAVHPERYELVGAMAAATGATLNALIGNSEKVRAIKGEQFVTEGVGLPTIRDILAELEKPGRDPRAEFNYATFSDSVKEIRDLAPGMKLEGTVTNVTAFGAFVDIGVHQDGLVHISQLADRFVADPTAVVKAGQVVKVTVLAVDGELKRISLSMKSEPEAGKERHEPAEKPPRPPRREPPRDRPQQASPRPERTPAPERKPAPPVKHATLEDLMRHFGSEDKRKGSGGRKAPK